MPLVKTRAVPELAGITADQLREWTVRRALILPDVPAQRRGSEARFSWRTVLLLRLASTLRTRFRIELGAQRELLAALRYLLARTSFPALWGATLAIYDGGRCELLYRPRSAMGEDTILLGLDRHLEVLSRGFGDSDPNPQLPLFPAIPLAARAGAGRRAR